MVDTQVLIRHPVTGQLHPITVSAEARMSELLPLAVEQLGLPHEVGGQPVDYWLEDDRESVRLMPNVRVRLVGSDGNRVVRLGSNAPVPTDPVYEPPASAHQDTLQAAVDEMLEEGPSPLASEPPAEAAESYIFEPTAELRPEDREDEAAETPRNAFEAPVFETSATILAPSAPAYEPAPTMLPGSPEPEQAVVEEAMEAEATIVAAAESEDDSWVSDRSGSGASVGPAPLPRDERPERPAAERPAPPPPRRRDPEGTPAGPPTSTVIMHVPSSTPGRPRPTPPQPADEPAASTPWEPRLPVAPAPEPATGRPADERPSPPAPVYQPTAFEQPPAPPPPPRYEPPQPPASADVTRIAEPGPPPQPPAYTPPAQPARGPRTPSRAPRTPSLRAHGRRRHRPCRLQWPRRNRPVHPWSHRGRSSLHRGLSSQRSTPRRAHSVRRRTGQAPRTFAWASRRS